MEPNGSDDNHIALVKQPDFEICENESGLSEIEEHYKVPLATAVPFNMEIFDSPSELRTHKTLSDSHFNSRSVSEVIDMPGYAGVIRPDIHKRQLTRKVYIVDSSLGWKTWRTYLNLRWTAP